VPEHVEDFVHDHTERSHSIRGLAETAAP
jgi:hypothetical protein